jgi:hypothetical protein
MFVPDESSNLLEHKQFRRLARDVDEAWEGCAALSTSARKNSADLFKPNSLGIGSQATTANGSLTTGLVARLTVFRRAFLDETCASRPPALTRS